jgi:NAD(P)H-hydrate epimerase
MTDPAGGAPAVRDVPVLIGAAEMAAIDQAAQALGLTEDALMESAGAAVAEVALVELSRLAEDVRGPGGSLVPSPSVVVLCGTGNNGGDGFVAARRLAAAGRSATVLLAGDPSTIRDGAARRNWAVLEAMAAGGSLALHVAVTADDVRARRATIAGAGLLIDALLGSGSRGQLREPILSAAELLNAVRTHATAAGRPCRVLAVDAPTLIDLTSGVQSDPVVQADLTVTFHRAKAGFAVDPDARRLAGRYLVAPIGIPLEAEAGIVPADGEFPPARLTEVRWQDPAAAD